jgi:hypothetical protein
MSEREIQNVMEMLQHPNIVTSAWTMSVQCAQSQLLTIQVFYEDNKNLTNLPVHLTPPYSQPHFRIMIGYEFSKLSMHFFKLGPEILICLPLVPTLIKNQSANIWKIFDNCYVNTMTELSMQLFELNYSGH